GVDGRHGRPGGRAAAARALRPPRRGAAGGADAHRPAGRLALPAGARRRGRRRHRAHRATGADRSPADGRPPHTPLTYLPQQPAADSPPPTDSTLPTDSPIPSEGSVRNGPALLDAPDGSTLGAAGHDEAVPP